MSFRGIEPHATINGVKVDFQKTPDRSITKEQWKQVRANSPGFRDLYPKLNDEALLDSVQNHLNNIDCHCDCTYEYSLANFLVPEMMKRIKIGYERKLSDTVARYVAIITLINFASNIFITITMLDYSKEFRFVLGFILSALITYAYYEIWGKKK
jgi:hypothetical protein